MDKMRKDPLKTNMNYELIIDTLLLLFGLFLLILPKNGLISLTIVFAIALIIIGIVCAAVFVMRRAQGFSLLAFAVAAIILGVCMLIFRTDFTLVLLPIIIAVWMVASAALCFVSAMDYRRLGATYWWIPLIAALLALIIAVLVFFNLSGTATFLARVIGLYFVIFNAIRIGEYFTVRRML